MPRRVLVIGLDGATFDLIEPWAKQGVLPNIDRLLQQGTRAALRSTWPHATAPAWTTFATGANPGQHGIFDFLLPESTLENLRTVTSADIKVTTFYEMLERAGRHCILVNLPVSYPPRIDRGIVITSLMTQGQQWVYPSSLLDKYPQLHQYRIGPDGEIAGRGTTDEYIADIRRLEKTRFECARELFTHEPWDFFFFLISGTDWIQHRKYTDLIRDEPTDKLPAVKAFREFDSYIGWFLDNLPQDTNLFIISDHGFCRRDGIFFVNTWLHQEGYLELTAGPARRNTPSRLAEEREEARTRKRSIRLGRWASILQSHPRLRKAARRAYHLLRSALPLSIDFKSMRIDVSRSQVYMTWEGGWGIYVNDKSRFEVGLVEAEKCEPLRAEIMAKLRSLRDPESGQPVFEEVKRKEEVYTGTELTLAPDILLASNTYQVDAIATEHLFWRSSHNGHSPLGILIALGPDIRQGERVSEAGLADLVPTILHVMGLPVRDHMDGRVLQEVFRADSEPMTREVTYAEAESRTQEQRREAEDSQEVKDRLRALGYLD
jgi:predicted AlkP superfamily phosphohydrolase/phosphomutase